MQYVNRLLIALLIATFVSPVLAADPQPQSPAQPAGSPKAEAVPQLDINQAEREAGVVLETIDPAAVPMNEQPMSPMIAEINAALEISHAQVAELTTRAAETPDPSGNLAIQQQIAELKQQAELDILAIQARYARAAGNLELAQQIDEAIAAISSPPAPTAPTTPRPAPGSQR